MLLFCVKTIMKESHDFDLARVKKKKKKKKESNIWPSGDFLVQYLNNAFSCLWVCCLS